VPPPMPLSSLQGQSVALDAAIIARYFRGVYCPHHSRRTGEPELVGPALWRRLDHLLRGWSRFFVRLFGLIIFFRNRSRIVGAFGKASGIDEFFTGSMAGLWLRSPRILVGDLGGPGTAQSSMGALISSKVNQWTLL